MSRVITLAVIPGDGIGPEVVAEAEKVLDAATRGSDVEIEKVRFSFWPFFAPVVIVTAPAPDTDGTLKEKAWGEPT